MGRWILIALAAGLVAAVGWKLQASLGEGGKGGRQRPSFAVPVEVAPVATASLRDTRLFSGTLRPGAQYVVAPKIGGRLERLRVDLGDEVELGQLVAELDDDEFQLQVEQDKAELRVARSTLGQRESELNVAQAEFDRARSLHAKQITSQAVLDTAAAAYHARLAERNVAEAQVAQRAAALAAAEVRLSYTRLRATWSSDEAAGSREVGARFADEGALLAAGSPVVSLIDLDPLVAVINVIERDYPRLRAGLRAELATDAYPGRTFAARIARISPLLQETSRQAAVELEVPNPDLQLKPGMFVRVRLELERREQACVVPRAALVRRQERDGVFQLDGDGKARFVPVELGIVSDDRAEVVRPRLRGDVVTLGQHLLVDGTEALVVARAEAVGPGEPIGAEPAKERPDPAVRVSDGPGDGAGDGAPAGSAPR